MIKNYLKIAIRNLTRHRGHTFINIAGLSVGMAVAILIGLWLHDELSFNKYYENYDRIAQVMQNQSNNGEVQTRPNEPLPLGPELRKSYGSDFKYITMATGAGIHTLAAGEKSLSPSGVYFEPQALDIFSIKMLRGSRAIAFKDPNSIILSASLAKAYFGDEDPMDKVMKLGDKSVVKVTGVYEDQPYNTTFADASFFVPWQLFVNENPWMDRFMNEWGRSSFLTYVQIADNVDMAKVSAKIKKAKLDKCNADEATHKPELFLHPMSKWHLYTDFKNGVNVGGSIQYVWLFGIIGIFILLLACINFMNLSTARSEKRAKEVGVRKAVGSLRGQLIVQFLTESVLIAAVSFLISICVVQFCLPYFNQVAGKRIQILWSDKGFWLLGLGFTFITGLLAGSYPAFYLSSFKAVKVLKGTFKTGKYASNPRRALIVVQFTVSVFLIICTIVVFRQIKFAESRPIGYDKNNLLSLSTFTPDVHKNFAVIKDELLKAGAITQIAESGSPTTSIGSFSGGLDWKGKDPGQAVVFPNIDISYDYGKTIGWQFKSGRDFSKAFATDSAGFVINEAAVRYMGLKKPVGETISWNGQLFHVIGVVKDMIMGSPYQQVEPSFFYLNNDGGRIVTMKINPAIGTGQALEKISAVMKKYAPSQPANFQFVDEDYAQKFGSEKRAGQLASSFATLAIFISCLGLFGMASFIAEQRTGEIGIRKVLGASVTELWRMLSAEFVLLVLVSLFVAIPVAYYFTRHWLQQYEYRAQISWWIFVLPAVGAFVITLVTVSLHTLRAAMANPVKSLRNE
ncbi:ABC-type antimicrobial peptide transport system permease subunit [Mucilaginibacter rubeus]|uniref:ABC transporter permease n=1 Tax=Mucilaginibacter rubeus TaxID=2027860 RepID=UPI00339A1F6F